MLAISVPQSGLDRSKNANSDGSRNRARGELGRQHVGCGRHRVDRVSPGNRNCANFGNGDTLCVDTRPGQYGRFPAMDGYPACGEDGNVAGRTGRSDRHRVPLTGRQQKDEARETEQSYSSPGV